LRRDRHVRRRLLRIESLECRALMSADGLVAYVDPLWFADCSGNTTLHAGATNLSTESVANQPSSGLTAANEQNNVYDWIVQFNTQSLTGITAVDQVSTLLVGGGIEFQVLRGLGLVGQVLVQSSGVSLDSATNWLANDVNIAGFEQDSVRQFEVTSNDPGAGQVYSMGKIDAADAWNLTTGSKSVVVGVVDTGIDYTHPDLAANIWKNPGEIPGNGIDDDHDGFVDDVHGFNFVSNTGNVMDDNGHGTHVAGTIAAVGNNSVGVVGVNWSASLMALKFLDSTGSGYVSDAVRAINYATMMRKTYGVNVRVLNNSWGGGGYSAALDAAITASNNAGILFVAAAGNNATNNDTTAQYPANYTAANVISVAASDQTDKLASFSNYGATTVDLAAPGVNIYSTLPNNRYGTYSGTSMATPLVSGVAALSWAYKSDATVTDVRNAILQGVDKISSLSRKVASGGRLDAYNTLKLLVASAAPSAPVLGSLVVNPSSTVTKGATVTLVAQGATSTIGVSAVYFYQDTNGNGTFDAGDTSVGYDNTVLSGTAELSIGTGAMSLGTNRFFARALDKNNQWSTPLSTILTVAAPVVPDDYGNNASAAATIALNSTIAGSIETGGDQDWFKFQAVAGKKYAISTTLAGLLDSVLTLYDRNGTTQLAYNDDISSNNAASRILWTAPASGTYYIKTSAFDSHQTGGYRLSLALQNSPPVLQAISNQTMSYRTDKLVIPLSATDVDGDKLTFSATAYTIDPTTKTPTNTPLAGNKVSLSLSGNQLIVDPAASYTGEFYVTVTVGDGTNSDSKSFKVSVTNSAPAIQSIGDQILSSKTGGVTIPLAVSDADGDRLTLSAAAYTINTLGKSLANVPVPSSEVSISLSGNQLRINRAGGYTGSFYVNVTASDGTNSVSKSFKVTATNATQQWLVGSSISSLSVDEDLAQQPAATPWPATAVSPAIETNRHDDWPNLLSATCSNDTVQPLMQGNNLSHSSANTSVRAVESALYEILDLQFHGGIRTVLHTSGENANSPDGAADAELLKQIEASLASLHNQTSDIESIDAFFALLADAAAA